MFTTDEAVNYILNASKMIVDEINKDKNCPKELKEIQYLIFAGMVAYYGYEYIELIHNVTIPTQSLKLFTTIKAQRHSHLRPIVFGFRPNIINLHIFRRFYPSTHLTETTIGVRAWAIAFKCFSTNSRTVKRLL